MGHPGSFAERSGAAEASPLHVSRRVRQALCLALLSAACDRSAESDLVSIDEYPDRLFAAATWDTVAVIGGRNAQDTTLISPTFVRLWGEDLLVLDYVSLSLRLIDGQGRLQWVYDRQGGGPGEFKYASSFAITPDGYAWVLDPGNQKILEFEHDGTLRRELSLRHFPAVPTAFGFRGKSAVFTTLTPGTGLIIASGDSLESTRTWPFPWPETIDAAVNFHTFLSGNAAGSDTAVIAFYHGPGFIVLEGDRATPHRYIEHVPFALRVSPRLQEERADSARFAARSVRVVGDEIFFLFGGRPVRYAHMEGEPTRFIDVYGVDGAYKRSYLLPFSAREMDTSDGEVFYLSTDAEDLYPQIIGLRPRQ